MQVNIDMFSAVQSFLSRITAEKTVREEDLYPFVDIYKGTQVKDVLFNIFGQVSDTSTEYFSDYFLKYTEKTENGIAVNYEDRYLGLYRINKLFGIDPFKVWIRHCREIGLNPWISFRVNDCHDPDSPASLIRSYTFYEAKANGWMIGDHYGYFRNCLDFSYRQVTDRLTAYITEQTDIYDPYGIELDFSREFFCFDYLNHPDCHKIMTAWLREIRAVTDRLSKIKGHKIKISIRLMRDIEQNKILGFDVETIVREKLVDLIVVTPRWETNDSDMPIREWKRRFPDMEIYAGIDGSVCYPGKIGTADVARGFAADYLTRGADGFYLYNHFTDPDNPTAAYKADKKRLLDIYTSCGSVETIKNRRRRHIVTRQDLYPENCKPWKPLPMQLTPAAQELHVRIGIPANGKKTNLIIGIPDNHDIKNADICVNGNRVTGFSLTEQGTEYTGAGVVNYIAAIDIGNADTALLTVSSRAAVPPVICYAEVSVE